MSLQLIYLIIITRQVSIYSTVDDAVTPIIADKVWSIDGISSLAVVVSYSSFWMKK